jgi:tRNA (cmo5U34)-methyltransferase
MPSAYDITAPTYDANRSLLIPCYDTLYRRAIDLIPAHADHILDLGTGTGLLAAWVRQRFPTAQLHLIDNSEPMLTQARERLADDPNTTYQLADYTTADLGSNYDAIVSALSIHHLDDPAKQSLFARIFTALKPGGIFVNAEQVLGPTPALEARYKHLWLAQVRAAGATPTQIADSLFRQQDDRCASVEDHLTWLRAAGFSDADCWFKDNRFAVLAAIRPDLAASK